MKNTASIFPIRWTQTFCLLAGLYAIVVAAYIVIETGKPSGSSDYHQFWYAGNFVIQQHDPYAAFYAGDNPELPIKYVDGITVSEYPVAQEDLETAPTNTPTMVLLLTPFSYFSWDVAKHLFLIVNLLMMLATGWLTLRHIPFADVTLASIDELLIFLVYFDLSATRIAIENGQTTLTVFLFMLLAILYSKRSWKISGIALGLAFSKYSLSLPVFLFFLYKRNFKVLIVSAVVQVLGVLALAAVTRTTPVAIAMENIRLFFDILNQPGVFVNLSSFFQGSTDNPLLSLLPVFVMTLLIFALLLFWQRGRIFKSPLTDDVTDFHILTILFIWTMLVVYHRIYDTLILIFFVVLVFKGLNDPNIWKLKKWERGILLIYMAAIPPIWILPDRLVDQVFTSYYGRISNGVTSTFFTVMLFISIYMLWRYLQNKPKQDVVETADSHNTA